MILTLLFDYNGVLNYSGHLQPFSQLLAQSNQLDPDSIYAYFKQFGPQLDLDAYPIDQFWQAFKAQFKLPDSFQVAQTFNQAARFNQDIFSLINQLKANTTIKIFLASNLNRDTADYLKTQPLFQRSFDAFYFSSDLKARKPQPEFFRAILRQSQLDPSECLFIDDDPEFVRAAQTLKLKTILFKNSVKLERNLRVFWE